MEEDKSFDIKFLEFVNDPDVANYFFELSSKALDNSIKQRELYVTGTILPVKEMYDKNLSRLDLDV